MLDQTILLREDSFETSEAVHEIQLAISRNGCIEMKDESWTKRDVLYVHDRTVGSHFLEMWSSLSVLAYTWLSVSKWFTRDRPGKPRHQPEGKLSDLQIRRSTD